MFANLHSILEDAVNLLFYIFYEFIFFTKSYIITYEKYSDNEFPDS